MRPLRELKGKRKRKMNKKIVCFGDSVTQGCFEILKENGAYELIVDSSSCYGEKLIEKLKTRYANTRFELINSGVSGDGLIEGIARADRDVFAHNPDILIFCFMLNDISRRDVDWYGKHLEFLFDRFKKAGITTLVMSSNMVNKYVAPDTPEIHIKTAEDLAECQNGGVLDAYAEKLKEKTEKYGFYYADAYAAWKKLDRYGIDTTMLLCNRLNHPARKMHGLFADILFDCMEKKRLIEK